MECLNPNLIKALGEVQNYMPNLKAEHWGCYTGKTLTEVAALLALPPHVIWFFSIAGVKVAADYRLGEGEEVTIHSPIDGGN